MVLKILETPQDDGLRANATPTDIIAVQQS